LRKIALIIPVLNEEGYLPKLLEQLRNQQNLEIVVVDGGSEDRSMLLAKKYPLKLCQSEKSGRSTQLNLGAKESKDADYYLFLHADVLLPSDFFEKVNQFIDQKHKLGNFRLQFDENHWFLHLNAFFTRFKLTCFQFGDQGLLIECNLFNQVGGYDENRSLVEGQDIIRRAKKIARFKKIPAVLSVSARKYRQYGYFYLQFCYLIIYILYRLNQEDETLRRWLNRLLGLS